MGARLYHEGQLDGLRTRIPVFLARGPEEPVDEELRAFYERLLHAAAGSSLKSGAWQMCDCSGWPDNDSDRQLLSWCWSGEGSRHLVVVNYADAPAQARVHLPWPDLAGREWQLADLLDGRSFARDGQEIADSGLYVALDPWACHFLSFAA